jgi:hypothetical protein
VRYYRGAGNFEREGCMTIAALTLEEREIIRRVMEVTFQFFDKDFETRLGVTPDAMRKLLQNWPNIFDDDDGSDACLAINNAMNDLLHGIGISDEKALQLAGANRSEMLRVYQKWAKSRGWQSTGVR